MCLGEGRGLVSGDWAGGWGAVTSVACPCLWAGLTGSVVLEEREQVIVAVRWEVGWSQVGQQLIRVGQFWEQLRTKQTVLRSALPLRGRPVPTPQPGPSGLGCEVPPPPTQALQPVCRGSPRRRQLCDQESLSHIAQGQQGTHSTHLRWLSCSRHMGSTQDCEGTPM